MAIESPDRIDTKTGDFSSSGAHLVSCKRNPVPEGASTGLALTVDGAHLRYANWPSLVKPVRGTVLLLQGRAEFIEKYFETVDDLRNRGFDVVAFDWRGQGASERLIPDRDKGHVSDFKQYINDLDCIMTDVMMPDCKAPYFILAHSMGSLVALLAAPSLANRIERMVLASPLLQLHTLPMKQGLLQKVFGFMTFAGFGRLYADPNTKPLEQRSFTGNKLTSDRKRYARILATLSRDSSLSIAGPTVSWVFAACNAMQQVSEPEYSAAITIPTLLVNAGNDTVVEPMAAESFGRKMRSGSCLLVSGAKHELLQERDVFRSQLLAAFDAFVPGDAMSHSSVAGPAGAGRQANPSAS